MAADWYCKIAGAELGPLTSQQLKALAADGRLRPDDEVCQGEGGKWVQAGRVKGLIKSASSEVLVARPLEDEPSAKPKAGGSRSSSGTVAAVPKAKSAAAPPEPPAATVPVAKAAAAKPAAQAVAAQSPFNFAGPDTNRSASSRGRATGLSPADAAKHRQKKRKKLLLGSVGALIVLAVVGVVLILVDPFGFGSTEEEGPSDELLAAQQFKEGELGDELSMDIDDLVGDDDAAGEVDESGEKWLDAAKQKATAGPVTVRIVSVAVGKPRIVRSTGKTATPKEDCLIITFELVNTDPKKKVGHSGWSQAPMVKRIALKDNLGNPYEVETFSRSGTIEGQQNDTSLYADDPVRDVLVFERPVEAAEYLRLELPAATFGEENVLRFQIPRKMIGKKAEEKAEEVATATSDSDKTEPSSEETGDDGDGEVYQLEAVERAIGGMEPAGDKPLGSHEMLKRDNPELFPD